MVKNPPFNAGDKGLIPGQGTKMTRAMELLRLRELEKPVCLHEDPVQSKKENTHTHLVFRGLKKNNSKKLSALI